MTVTDFTATHAEEARRIAMQNYEAQRGFVPALPPIDAVPDLVEFADNGMGVAAIDGGEMLGFLCAYLPVDNVFGTTDVKGAWSPVHAHAAVEDGRGMIYKRMYQAAAEKWVRAGAVSHAITLYAHDKTGLDSFFQYAFGLRFVDAIRMTDHLGERGPDVYRFAELGRKEAGKIAALRNLLIDHLGQSPCFLRYPHTSERDVLDRAVRENLRIFTAADADKIIGYIEITASGENFVCDAPDMMNICGAYLLPEYHGKGIHTGLLSYLADKLKGEDYTRLGVDFESINPTAWGFWLKYFDAFTHSIVRRIDEHALKGRI